MDDLVTRLRRHVASARLFPDPGLALVAVSGGPDSVALLDLLATLAPEWGLTLAVAHVDHGIAPESGVVARQVEALAGRYGLPVHGRTVALGAGASETAARRARYAALRAVQNATGARYLITAHHADDQAETVLLRLLKGSGPAGLAGIPASGPRGLVRPLLPFARAELGAWLARRGVEAGAPLPVHDDPANTDERHDRSWLRERVLPILRERFGPEVDRRLVRATRYAGRERRAWAALLGELPGLDVRARAGVIEVARAPLARYDNTLTEAVLRALARQAGCVLGPRRAERLAQFVRVGSSGGVLELGGGWEVELAFDRVRLVRRPHAARGAIAPVAIGAEPSGRVEWNSWEFRWCAEPAGTPARAAFTTWVTPGDISIRSPAAGDRLVPLGGVGRRKVRRLLMEARVPARERGGYPLLVHRGDVWWVPGICRAAAGVPPPGEPAVRIEAHATGRD